MASNKHKVFISYHHANDEGYKKALLKLNELYELFVDASVDTGDIDENLDDETIRQKIRDEYLKDSSITIVLVGTETKNRKHIDWEIYSSMFNGSVNKQSGILVINLPTTECTNYTASHGKDEKSIVYPENNDWFSITTRTEYENRYPYLPARIIDNLLNKKAKISVTNWKKVTEDIGKLRFLINATYDDHTQCEYDLSRPMRKSDS
ncbi:MAG: TIR domain-containing protein [Planctomycetota bacterium]